MKDLISRSKVLEIIHNHSCDTARIEFGVLELPTAYDIELVVDEINRCATTMATARIPHKYMKAIGTKKCEEIVRRGGVTDERVHTVR